MQLRALFLTLLTIVCPTICMEEGNGLPVGNNNKNDNITREFKGLKRSKPDQDINPATLLSFSSFIHDRDTRKLEDMSSENNSPKKYNSLKTDEDLALKEVGNKKEEEDDDDEGNTWDLGSLMVALSCSDNDNNIHVWDVSSNVRNNNNNNNDDTLVADQNNNNNNGTLVTDQSASLLPKEYNVPYLPYELWLSILSDVMSGYFDDYINYLSACSYQPNYSPRNNKNDGYSEKISESVKRLQKVCKWFRLLTKDSLIVEQFVKKMANYKCNPSTEMDVACQYEVHTWFDDRLRAQGNNNAINRASETGLTPLMYAAHYNKIHLLNFLLKRGADLHVCGKMRGSNALVQAIRCMSYDASKWLIEHGADVNETFKKGATPLMHAAVCNAPCAAELLLQAGARINDRDEEGNTALIWALKHGSIDMVSFLIEQEEINVNARNNKERTALWYAVRDGTMPDFVQVLQAQGATL